MHFAPVIRVCIGCTVQRIFSFLAEWVIRKHNTPRNIFKPLEGGEAIIESIIKRSAGVDAVKKMGSCLK